MGTMTQVTARRQNKQIISARGVFSYLHAESGDLPAHNGMSIIYINKQTTIRSRLFNFNYFGMYFD